MDSHRITVLILTYNEEPNIRRCLERLKWAHKVLVIDSGSTDRTLQICGEHSNVKCIRRAFDSFAEQCNFGLSLITTEWTLSIDADYLISSDFPLSVTELDVHSDGYSFGFRYFIGGRALRCGLYPPRTVLYRTAKARYENVGHGHRVCISGEVTSSKMTIDHDDRKPLACWLDSQRKYAVHEACHLTSSDSTELGWADKIRKRIWVAVPAIVFYVLVWKKGLFDGWPGIYYALQRAHAELLLSIELLDRKINAKSHSSAQAPSVYLGNELSEPRSAA